MNKFLTKIATFGLGMIMAIGVGVAAVTSDGFTRASAAGQEVTISFASTAQRVSQNTSKQVWKNGDVTFTNNKGSSTNNVANYSNPVRLYANSEIVIDAPGNLSKIVFDANSPSYATTLKNSASSGTVSVSSDKVTITLDGTDDSYTIAKLTGQVRLDSLTVTYVTSGGGSSESEPPSSSEEPETPVVPEQGGKGGEDKLVKATTGASGTTYISWSNKTISGGSGAVYAGSSAGGNESIQLRSSNNSGIISTTTGGKLAKVDVEWNSNTASGRTLDVYGKTSAYSSTSELYAGSTQGTKLGSIVKGTSTLIISGDYTYIGLRSNNGAMYLTSITITWASSDSAVGIELDGKQTKTFTAGDKFSLGEGEVNVVRKSGLTETISANNLTYTLGGTAITTDTVLKASDNDKQVVVSATIDGTKFNAEAYTIKVSYKETQSITLNRNSLEMSLTGEGSTATLTATVSDQYANPTVSWSLNNENVVALNKDSTQSGDSITITAVGGGSANIIASTSDGKTAICEVTVSSEASLTLINEEQENVTNAELPSIYSGANAFTLSAHTVNFLGEIQYTWSVSVENSFELTPNENSCSFAPISHAEDIQISCRVVGSENGDLTVSATIDVLESLVTSVSLSSTDDDGIIYNGSYNNKLTLTSSVESVGVVSNAVTWTVTDDNEELDVVTYLVNNNTLTVNAANVGVATIRATSDFTPTQYKEYTVTVAEDGVRELQWESKPYFDSNSSSGHIKIIAGETTLGDVAASGSKSFGVFTATWVSGLVENPTVGTTEDDVQLCLCNNSYISEPLTSDYVFKIEDSGMVIRGFYKGKQVNQGATVKVLYPEIEKDGSQAIELNVVGVSGTLDGTDKIYWENNGVRFENQKTSSSNALFYTDSNLYRVYANSHCILNSENEINKIIVYATDNSYANVLAESLNGLGCDVQTDDKVVTISKEEGFTSLEFDASAQFRINKIVFGETIVQDTAKNRVADFIENYMMLDEIDYISANENKCLTEGYYQEAKDAYLILIEDEEAKTYFWEDEHVRVVAARERFVAWAAANNDRLDPITHEFQHSLNIAILGIDGSNPESITLLIVTVLVALSTVAFIYFKKREQNAR